MTAIRGRTEVELAAGSPAAEGPIGSTACVQIQLARPRPRQGAGRRCPRILQEKARSSARQTDRRMGPKSIQFPGEHPKWPPAAAC